MSLKSICEVILLFESFKNIDLCEQGAYKIHAKIDYDQQHAPPHRNFETKKELRSRKKNKIREEADLLDNEYKTKTFMIKYNDEEIDLEEVVVFRLELETFPTMATSNIYLHLDLHFTVDYNYGFDSHKGRELEYQRVDSIKLKLNAVERGTHCFLNASFSDDYKAILKLNVFSIMMDTKFRLWRSPRKEKGASEVERERVSSMGEFFQYYLKKTGKGEDGFYSKYIKSLREYSQFAKKNLSRCVQDKVPFRYRLPKYCLSDQESSLELVEVDPKTYMQYINVYKSPSYSPARFLEELQQISTQNHLFLQQFLVQLQQCEVDTAFLRAKFNQFSKGRFGEFIFQNPVTHEELSSEKCSMKEKVRLARKIRNKKHYFENLEPYEVQEDETILAEHPIIFHEITEMNQDKPREYEVINMLFVLCHGFQGSSDDMISIKNGLKASYPKAHFLLARSNEGSTDGDIRKMGERLASEVQDHILDEDIKEGLVIHMIGHSLGGIILRTALKHLTKYRDNLGTFLSLSSPHLSYLNGTKTSIQTGLWVIKKWKKIESFEQMTMTDHKDKEKTFMFNLSKEGHLADFHRVVLVSCPEDSYVPWHSARIHRSSDWAGQSVALENQMSQNILKSERIYKVHRLSVDFHLPERTLDTMIGRAAHIRFLNDETVLKMILSCIEEVFH